MSTALRAADEGAPFPCVVIADVGVCSVKIKAAIVVAKNVRPRAGNCARQTITLRRGRALNRGLREWPR